jgi:hypothetical protein
MIAEEKLDKMVTTKNGNHRLCIITSRSYNDTMEYFHFLMEVARKDFPELTDKDVMVKRYAGRFRKGMFGIEFQIDCDDMPESYEETSDRVICSMYPTN